MISAALPPPTLPTYQCVLMESGKQLLPPLLLVAVMHQEGGRPGSVSKNKNGSFDLGPMQINSSNITRIAKVAYNSKVIDEDIRNRAAGYIINDGCANISVGAWMLRSCINAKNGDLFRGIGCYNSPTRKYADRYAVQVLKRYGNLRSRYLSAEWF